VKIANVSTDLSGEAHLLADARVDELYITHKAYSYDFAQSWHEHDRASIDFVLAGGGVGVYAGKEVRARPGIVEFCRHEMRHKFVSGAEGIRTMHVVIPAGVLGGYNRLMDTMMSEMTHSRAVGLAARLLRELMAQDASSKLEMESLVYELLDEVSDEVSVSRRRAGWVGRVRDVLHEVSDRPVGLGELADVAGVDKGHLARVFSQKMGMSAGVYHRRLRVAAAARSLTGSCCSIARIARDTGFSDQAHLSRVFKKHYGITPGAMRKTVQAGSYPL
jgi:AraC-like DNA-binding protein